MPFAKGQSGNPGGLKKGTREANETLMDAMRKLGPLSAQVIGKFAKGGKSIPPELQLKAAMYVQDRLLGKAAQAVQVTGEQGGPLVVSWLSVPPPS